MLRAQLRSIWRSLFRRSQVEQEMVSELQFHIAERIDDLMARHGLARPEAIRRARLEFGSTDKYREQARASLGLRLFDDTSSDVRYALRQLRRSPAFTAVVIATLGVAIGITTAVFSVFDAVVLKPVTYRDASRLVWIAMRGGVPADAVLSTDFAAWQEQATSFERLVAYSTANQALSTGDAAIQTRVASVSGGFWDITDAPVVLGRLPLPGERQVVLLSHRLFQGWFRGNATVIGQTVSLQGQPTAIIGVLSPEFTLQFPQPSFVNGVLQAEEVDAYRPMGPFSQDRHQGTLVRVVGKLKPETDLTRAHADIETVRTRLAQTSPLPFSDRAQLLVTPLQMQLAGNNRVGVTAMLIAGAFVLIIACANIAGLVLARAATRQHEMTIRASIGAGRQRLMRQLLTESVTFSLIGGVIGVAIAQLGVGAFITYGPDTVPRLANAVIDARVLGVVTVMTALTALVCGLGPAVSVVRLPLETMLRSSPFTLMAAQGRRRVLSVLVVVQIATAVVLLTGAGLMLKTIWYLDSRPPGFDPERILTMRVELVGPQYRSATNRLAYVDELLRRVSGAPGVVAAGITTGAGALMRLRIEGRPDVSPGERPPDATVFATSTGYAAALGFRMVEGRWISDTDVNPVLVINESLARREFGTESPLGHRIRLPWPAKDPNPPFATIVGVVEDLRYSQLDAEPDPEVFVPYALADLYGITLNVRTATNPSALAASLAKLASEVDRSQPVFNVKTLNTTLAESIALRRFLFVLTATFATIAVFLALLGIYALMTSTVVALRYEIGLRIALGAPRDRIRGVFLRRGLQLAAVGVVLGVVGAALTTRLIGSLLFRVGALDPITFAAVSIVLTTAAAAAAYVPARRASNVDPMVALRSE